MAMVFHTLDMVTDEDMVLIHHPEGWYWFYVEEDGDSASNGPFDSNGLAILNYMNNYLDMEKSRSIREMKTRLANTGKATGAYMSDQQEQASLPQKPRLITVTGDIGEYLKGQILKDPEAIAQYYRTCFKEGNGSDLKLTTEQILEVIDSVPGDTEDAEVERIEKLEELATS